MALLAAVLAHQGGWDEILMVAAPIGLVAALLVLANKRAKTLNAGDAEEAVAGEEGDGRAGAARPEDPGTRA